MIPYIRFWWHFSNIDNSTPVSQIKFGLIAKIGSIHAKDSLVTWVVLSSN